MLLNTVVFALLDRGSVWGSVRRLQLARR